MLLLLSALVLALWRSRTLARRVAVLERQDNARAVLLRLDMAIRERIGTPSMASHMKRS
ncbi:hypothetical protein LMG23994_01749 [Cupriavidus pinatubonensis]|uniref:Uncharacterized protein n=1 Tax=Cupriavidus pinatubonensis TaxID=248026 RepID=A0ABM8WR95_9BURK|nr:hypothetical protein LMG23994_01749 [Cupriavidus pinatubonensis]